MCHHYRISKAAQPLVVCVALWSAASGLGQELDLRTMFHEGIPPSPFMDVVYRFADAMLEHGRDVVGPRRTGLFFDVLDRESLSPLDALPPAPPGLPGDGRHLYGIDLASQENLLRLLYVLAQMSGEHRYADAADEQLQQFLTVAPSQATDLLPWGERLCWNAATDEAAAASSPRIHEMSRPWMLWDKCFQFAPEASRRFALAVWNRHVANQSTGAFTPGADYDGTSSRPLEDSPRHAGFFIRSWAEAYADTRDNVFLKATDVVLGRWEDKLGPDGRLSELGDEPLGALSALSLAIDCDGAARKVPEPLRTRLTRFAVGIDQRFCSLPHDLTRVGGFATMDAPAAAGRTQDYTCQWNPSRSGRATTAAVAMMCVSRYENTGRVGYRNLIVAAADAYLNSLPGADIDAWPMTFGHAISLELAAFRCTARRQYHTRGFRLGEMAIERFFGDSPLPRASLQANHYESATGADTLALALVELHLSTRGITAVRAPANTIDR